RTRRLATKGGRRAGARRATRGSRTASRVAPCDWWKRGGVELSRPKQDNRRSTTSVFGDLGSRASGPRRQGPGCASPVVICAPYRALSAQQPNLVAPFSALQAEAETRYAGF